MHKYCPPTIYTWIQGLTDPFGNINTDECNLVWNLLCFRILQWDGLGRKAATGPAVRSCLSVYGSPVTRRPRIPQLRACWPGVRRRATTLHFGEARHTSLESLSSVINIWGNLAAFFGAVSLKTAASGPPPQRTVTPPHVPEGLKRLGGCSVLEEDDGMLTKLTLLQHEKFQWLDLVIGVTVGGISVCPRAHEETLEFQQCAWALSWGNCVCPFGCTFSCKMALSSLTFTWSWKKTWEMSQGSYSYTISLPPWNSSIALQTHLLKWCYFSVKWLALVLGKLVILVVCVWVSDKVPILCNVFIHLKQSKSILSETGIYTKELFNI